MNGIVKLFLVYKTDVDRSNSSLAIDHKGGGQRFHVAIHIAGFIIAHDDLIVDFVFRNERLHVFPAAIVHGNAQNREPSVLVLSLKVGKPRDLDSAGSAPGCPEIEQHHFALVIGKMHHLPSGIF